MPQPKTDVYWIARISALAEDGWKPPKIAQILEAEAKELGKDDPPAPRTVQRYYEDHKKLSLDERRQRGLFHWPDSMVKGALGWTASRSALDLLRIRGSSGGPRPTNREARWFAYLRDASSTLPDEDANRWATALAANEFARALGNNSRVEILGMEWYLAFQPWRSHADEELLAEASKGSVVDLNPDGGAS